MRYCTDERLLTIAMNFILSLGIWGSHIAGDRYATRLTNYVLLTTLMDDVRGVVIGQSKYLNNIHPLQSSCFSYDGDPSYVPPSMSVLANGIHSEYCNVSLPFAISLFRDLWMHVASGVIFINAMQLCDGSGQTDAIRDREMHEMVHTADFICSYISILNGPDHKVVPIICFGSSAHSLGKMIHKTLKHRKSVHIEKYIHPAYTARDPGNNVKCLYARSIHEPLIGHDSILEWHIYVNRLKNIMLHTKRPQGKEDAVQKGAVLVMAIVNGHATTEEMMKSLETSATSCEAIVQKVRYLPEG